MPNAPEKQYYFGWKTVVRSRRARLAQQKARQKKAQQEAYSEHCQQHSRKARFQERYNRRNKRPSKKQARLEEKYPIQEDKGKKQDALDYAVSGGQFESNRRKH